VDSQSQHYVLQIQQLQKNLKQSEADLAEARRAVEQQRQMLIGLGEAFVPEAFAAVSSAVTGDDASSAKRLAAMSSAEIVALILRALSDKIAALTAFNAGLTAEQRERWIRRVVESDATDWVSDPALGELRQAVEQERQARLAAEQAARDAEARARQVEMRQAENAAELLRLRNEMRTLQEQLRLAQSAPRNGADNAASPSAVPSTSAAVSGSPSAVLPTKVADTSPRREYAQTPDDSREALVLVLATRGICERPRLAEILHREFGFGDSPNHFLVNKAFETATEQGLLKTIQPRTETGIGRAPHLVRLTEAGRAYAREQLKIEPAPSELDRLLKMHDTPEHVSLILQARTLFLEKYPEPVKSVELFPAPILLDGGKRSEPDLTVTLADGRTLLVECERDTPKNETQRADKWAKYYQVTRGEFYVVCPDPKAVSALASEINVWQVRHGGRVRLRVTSIHQVLTANDPARFWAYDRTLG
jgi:hypothetical protein